MRTSPPSQACRRRRVRRLWALNTQQGSSIPGAVGDRLGQYRRAFNGHFYRVARLVQGVPIACRQCGLRFNNNPIERHNQALEVPHRLVPLLYVLASAEAFLNLRRMVYNYVRTHQGLGRTPAEVAGIRLDLGKNGSSA